MTGKLDELVACYQKLREVEKALKHERERVDVELDGCRAELELLRGMRKHVNDILKFHGVQTPARNEVGSISLPFSQWLTLRHDDREWQSKFGA